MQKYSVNNSSIDSMLAWVKGNEIAIPEIQRPFVWSSSKVRDLMDSLYNGYPIGYIITWKNPDTKLKDGSISFGKKILIDGQQRITAMTAALLGEEVVDSDYKKRPIRIAFNPKEEKFEVLNPAIEKDSEWINDISVFFKSSFNVFSFVPEYCRINQIDDQSKIGSIITQLSEIRYSNIGVIELSHELDIETVTEIFIRINSQGVVLSQADFAMSKIAVNEENNGSKIRKTIDYFCHLVKSPADYEAIKKNDKEFSDTDYFRKISWIKNHKERLYSPDYSDLLRVSFTSKFIRGRLSNLVSLLSGRDFETREYKQEIVENSFELLEKGVLSFVSETLFKRYLMILKSAGIIDKKLVRSQQTLNFGYILYLALRDKGTEEAIIQKVVRKWVVLSILTGRYSGSPESMFDYDIRRFVQADDVEAIVSRVEEGELSDAFWDNILVTNLDTSVASSPYFNLFLMAQIKNNDKGFLSKEVEIKHLLEERGDIHHIFPKKYLQKNNYDKRGMYNQIANYVYTPQEINISIKAKSPKEYFSLVLEQLNTKETKLGEIVDIQILKENLIQNCIPEAIFDMEANQYETFLELRRKLMAEKIKNYYFSL
jgi:hypothetical protein